MHQSIVMTNFVGGLFKKENTNLRWVFRTLADGIALTKA